MKSQTLEITGMTCDACARHVEQALLSVPGVHTAEVSYPQGTARVIGDAMNTAVLASAVTGAGYGAIPTDDASVATRDARPGGAPETPGRCPPRAIVTPLYVSPSSVAAVGRWRRHSRRSSSAPPSR